MKFTLAIFGVMVFIFICYKANEDAQPYVGPQHMNTSESSPGNDAFGAGVFN